MLEIFKLFLFLLGFERTKGRCHAVKSGVLIFEADREKVLKNYEEYANELIQKQRETERKNILTLWRKVNYIMITLLKSVLILAIQRNFGEKIFKGQF